MNFTQIGQIGATGNGSFVDAAYQTFTFDLTGYISANTRIRFSVGDAVDGDADAIDEPNDDIVYVDNINVAYAAGNSTENGAPVSLGLLSQIADVDDTNMELATIVLTTNLDGAAEFLSVNAVLLPAGITVVGNNTTTIVLTGPASKAAYEAAIELIRYNNTSDNPTGGARTVTVTVNDGDDVSNMATTTITVVAVNDAPATDLNGGTAGTGNTAAFTEGTAVHDCHRGPSPMWTRRTWPR